MAELIGRSLARILASLTPAIIAILFVLISNLPLSVMGGLVPAPLLALAPIYFWAVLRPDLLRPFMVLMIGLFEDLLSGGSPGLWAAGFLAAYGVADRQRDVFIGLSGVGATLGFAAAVFAAAGTAYVLASLVQWSPAPMAMLLLECAVTIVLFPVLAFALNWANRNLIGVLRGDD